jgi:hypothetical protein
MNSEKLKDLADHLRALPHTRYYAAIITDALTDWYARKNDPSLLVELDMLWSWLKGMKREEDALAVHAMSEALRERARELVSA